MLRTCTPNPRTERLFQCRGNAEIGLYRLKSGTAPALCDSACPPKANPFLKPGQPFLQDNFTVEAIWTGGSIAQFGATPTDKQEQWGQLFHNGQLEVTMPRIDADIQSGLWAFVKFRYTGEMQSGELIGVDRRLPTMFKLIIDTSKIVPFPASLVDLDGGCC